jgi:putative salt-induced outer membrane protein YdiY
VSSAYLVAGLTLVVATGVMADEAVHVALPDGDRLTGTLVSTDGKTTVIHHAVLGDVSVPASYVVEDKADSGSASSGSSDGDHADGNASASEEPAEASPWSGSVSLAATASRTSSSTYNIRLGAEAHRKTDAEQFDLTASWYWNQSNGVTSDNDILVRAVQEWFIPESRWLLFAQGTWQYDQFEDWGHRVSPYGGVGYRVFDRDDLSLTLKGGAGVTWQYRGNEVDPQLLFEANTDWKIDDRQNLSGFASIAPDPVRWDHYLATLSVDWKYRLGDETAWAFNVGLRNIYDSNPSGGSTANDLKVYAGLSVEY